MLCLKTVSIRPRKIAKDENMKYAVLLFLMVGFSSVNAGSLVCDGVVDSVAYHGNNKLMVKLSSMNTGVLFCDPNRDWSVAGEPNRVMGAETCKAVFAIFLSARATGEHVSRVHFDGDNVPASCDQFENWKDVFIRYVNY